MASTISYTHATGLQAMVESCQNGGKQINPRSKVLDGGGGY
jgi:hypothetical protein